MVNEYIMVTGASRGIGLAVAQHLLRTGRKVVAVCRDTLAADRVNQTLAVGVRRGGARIVIADFSRHGAAAEIDRQLDEIPTLDGLINCVGVNRQAGETGEATRTLTTLESTAVEIMFRTNAITPLLLIAQLRDRLRRAELPRVVNLTSARAIPGPGEGGKYGYRASKAALNIFTRCAAADLREDGIVVVAVDPGWVRTEMGGVDAPLSAVEAATGLIELFQRLTLRDSGLLFSWDGREQPWSG